MVTDYGSPYSPCPSPPTDTLSIKSYPLYQEIRGLSKWFMFAQLPFSKCATVAINLRAVCSIRIYRPFRLHCRFIYSVVGRKKKNLVLAFQWTDCQSSKTNETKELSFIISFCTGRGCCIAACFSAPSCCPRQMWFPQTPATYSPVAARDVHRFLLLD